MKTKHCLFCTRRIVMPFTIFIIFATITLSAHAQQTNEDSTSFYLKKGAVLTGFSGGWASSARDDYHHEFEKGIRRFSINIDALYFISDRFAIGPELSYNYLYRDLEDPFETGEAASNDRWNWNTTYGGQVGWFIPTERIFGTSALGQSVFFAKGGINWERLREKSERLGKNDPQIQFGYALSAGLLIPLSKRIGLETSLRYEARRREYKLYEFDTGRLILDEVAWPYAFSLGVGLKIRL